MSSASKKVMAKSQLNRGKITRLKYLGRTLLAFGKYQLTRSNQQWIQQLRLDLEDPSIAFFVSEQHPSSPWVNIDKVNTGLRDMAMGLPNVFIISTKGLSHGRRHFGTLGTVQLGNAMADAYLRSN